MWKHSGRWSALYKSKRLLHLCDPWLWRILIGERSIKNLVAVSIWTFNTKNLGLRPQINPLLEIIKSNWSSNKTLLYLLHDRMVECSMFCGGGVGMEKTNLEQSVHLSNKALCYLDVKQWTEWQNLSGAFCWLFPQLPGMRMEGEEN